MPEIPDKDSSRGPQKRLQPFLDCIAYLLAKRWLRDQRQQEEKPPQEQQEPNDEQSTAD